MNIIRLFRFLKVSSAVLLLLLSLSISFICWGSSMTGQNTNTEKLAQVPQEKWDKLASKNIFFGHQSVGNNIMEGVSSITKRSPQIKLNIVDINTAKIAKPPFFVHDGNLGKNHNPDSKIDAFVKYVKNGVYNEKINIAFLKFCFVDIDSKTDIDKLFNKYKHTFLKLKHEYPDTVFVHFTVPLLKSSEQSFKSWLKKLLGKNDGFFANSHNVKRNKFNKLIIKEYKGKEPLFNLAEYESTCPDGERETFMVDGQKYSSLVPEYTEDGGHLNERGRNYIAEKLLIYLANLN